MDGDVSLAIRRARRAGAKALDLSHRGLRVWPDGLFALRHLESLDLSGNELVRVDGSLKHLDLLEELNLANNRLESLPDLDAAVMQHLRSVNLEGNPVATRMAPSAVRQLTRPPRTPGQTPAQVIGGLLAQARGGEGAGGGGGVVAEQQTGEVERWERSSDALDLQHFLGGDGQSDSPSEVSCQPWRTEQAAIQGELERLRARVKELEEAAAVSGSLDRPRDRQGSTGESLPSWLREESKHLSSTLPSRQRGFTDDDEASEAKSQLREEQRKCKRLENQVQKLSERLNEQDMLRGGVGSVPHFEFSEVELGEMMAQGGFSVVHRGCWHSTKIAIKKLFDPNITDELLAEFDNEVQKLEQIRHPNILMLLAVHRKPPALSIITELVEGGSLYQLLHTPSKFNSAAGPLAGLSLSQATEIMESSGTAIAFLHARGIAHRDVKSQNVLLSPALAVKLCDFGLARMKSELMTGAMQFAGTPNYMAPEIFRNQKYTETVDVFAYGTLFWEATVLDIPWANMDPADIRERVLAGQMLPLPRSMPLAIQALIRACWTMDRSMRPSMAEVMTRLRACTADEGP